MKIDWKFIATTPGYMSLKAAYIEDVQEAEKRKQKFGHAGRDKETFLKLFHWVICRAKHYALHENVTIDVILNRWEAERLGSKYVTWWLNAYGDYKGKGRIITGNNNNKVMTIKGFRASLKKDNWYVNDPIGKRARVLNFIMQGQKENSKRKDKKKRWDLSYKKHMRERKLRKLELARKKSL